jgi:hypothetical protein
VTSDVGAGIGGKESEGALELLGVTLAAEDGLAVDAEQREKKKGQYDENEGKRDESERTSPRPRARHPWRSGRNQAQ